MGAEFEKLYSGVRRASIPPEQQLRSLVLQMLCSTGSERMLVEQLEYNLLVRGGRGATDRREGQDRADVHERPLPAAR